LLFEDRISMNLPRQLLPIGSSLLGATAVVLIIAACSTTREIDPPPGFPDATTPDAGCVRCSPDLKQVLNGCEGSDDVVVEQCNPDQGCGNSGKCVDACLAAAQTLGSLGCDFWTVMPPTSLGEGQGNCLAALVANTWDRPVTISADFGSDPIDNIHDVTYTVSRNDLGPVYTPLKGPLPVGEVAVIFLSDEGEAGTNKIPCPKQPARNSAADLQGTGLSKAYHIKTDAPVSAYSMFAYGGAAAYVPAATLLLPASSWTTDYVAVSPFDFEPAKGRGRSHQIIATEDGTEVTVKPTANILGAPGVEGTALGMPKTWTLSKGQVLQVLGDSLSGSSIHATNHPVGVFGGALCSDIGSSPCDVLHQQIPPFAEWGTEYAVVPFRPRFASAEADTREQVPYTIVGGADGTELTYEPSRPANAPETLGSRETVTFITDKIFVVKSQDAQHPFHVNVYMTSAGYGGGQEGQYTLGDPEFVNVPAADQYLDRYVFLTDFSFPETALTFVRRKTKTGFMPVELECAGEITGWQPVGLSGEYEFAWVRLTSAFVPQKFAKGDCGYGRQEAHSKGTFAVTVWGTAVDASYGYVGGTGLRPANAAIPPPVR
jgi:hypothetical protein